MLAYLGRPHFYFLLTAAINLFAQNHIEKSN